MKKILVILLLGLGFLSELQAQVPWSVSGVKTRFTKGLGIPVADTTSGGAADTSHMVIRPQDGVLYYKRLGAWQAASSSAFYVPYTGAVDNVNLGNYRLTARSLKTDSIYANGSGGAVAVTNSGTKSFSWGAGGSSEVTFYGFAGMDFNRSGSMTSTSFTPKVYVDSSAALRVRYTDTAAMLAPFVQYSDTTGLFGQVVRTFGTQTIGGNKTFSNNITINTIPFGAGVGSGADNIAIGTDALSVSSSTNYSTAVGFSALKSNTGTSNSAFGGTALLANTTGQNNTGIGRSALSNNTDGSRNVAIGILSGTFAGVGSSALTSVNNSTYIGADINGSAATGVTNETVIGYDATGNGSNTVTIGNSSVTDNYFSGNIRGGSFIRSGGTSSQFLKADGSVDNNTYATTSSLSSYALTNLSNVNGVLSSTYGGAGSVSGILKANGSGVVSAAVAGTDYQTPITNPVTGTGMTNLVPKFTSSSSLGTSSIFDNGTSIGINNTTPPPAVTFNVNSGVVAAWFTSNNEPVPVSVINSGSAISTIGFKGSTTANAFNVRVGADGENFIAYTSNTEKMRITSGGDVLINTTTTESGYKLIVNGSTKVSERILAGSTSNTLNAFSGTNNSASHATIYSYNDNGAGWSIYSAKGLNFFNGFVGIGTNTPQRGLHISGTTAAAEFELTREDMATGAKNFNIWGNPSNGTWNFRTLTDNSGAESVPFMSFTASTGAATFSSSVTANSFLLDESGVRSWSITKSSGNLRFASGDLVASFVFANTTASTSTTTGALVVAGGVGIGGAVYSGGAITATGFIVSSDLRYKDIISQDGDLYKYTLKADPNKQIHYGYIAQEVEKTLPFAVTTNSDGYKAVNYTEVHAIKIRELEKRIEQLEKLLNK